MNISIDTSKIETDEDFVAVAKLMLKKKWNLVNIHDVSWDEQRDIEHLRVDND